MEEIIDLLRSCDNPVQAAEYALALLKTFQALGAKEQDTIVDPLVTSA
jgi:hypothetical protein